MNYRKDADAAHETVAAIEKLGRRARAYAASVDDGDACARMVDDAVSHLGTVDLLVHNTGIASRGQSVERTDPAELERVVRIHALGPHRLTQFVLPHIKQRPRGDVVMISSVATLYHGAFGAPYNMAKAAMESLAFTPSRRR